MIYDLPKDVRNLVELDVTEIDDKQIRSLDEYLLTFYKHRRACYQYLRESLRLDKNSKQIKLSRLHEILVIDKSTSPAAYADLIRTDPAYKNKIAYYAERREYWEKYQMHIDCIFWDYKHLKVPKLHKKAAIANHEITAVTKHWSMLPHRTEIQKRSNNYWKLQHEIKELSKRFYEELFKGIKLDSNLEITYLYRKILINEKSSKAGFFIHLSTIGTFAIHSSHQVALTKKHIAESLTHVMIAKYRCLQKMIVQINASSDKIRTEYHAEIENIIARYPKQYAKLYTILYGVMREFKDKASYSFANNNSIKLVFEFNGRVYMRHVTYANNEFRSTVVLYANNNDEISKLSVNHRAPLDHKTLAERTKEFVLEGFVNVYSSSYRMKLDSYFEIDSKPDEFIMCFMRDTLAEMQPTGLEYFNLTHSDCAKALDSAIKSPSTFEKQYILYKKSIAKQITGKREYPETSLERAFKRKNPKKYEDVLVLQNARIAETIKRSKQ